MKRFVLLLLLATGLGCWPGGLSLGPEKPPAPHQFTEPEVHSFLAGFCTRTAMTLETASIAMQDQVQDRALGRQVTLWKMAMLAECQRASGQDAALPAFLETWVFAVRHLELVTADEAVAYFGDQRGLAVAAAERLLDRIEAVAPNVIPPERLDAARQGVYRVAEQQAGEGELGREGEASTASFGSVLEEPVFSWATGVVLSPIRALEGVDQGAQAATQLAEVANRFASITEQLPQQVRWQMELLLYDIEDRETMEVMRKAVEQIGASADRLSVTAERLPEEIRASLRLALDDLGDAQADLQPTLVQTKATADSLEVALAAFQEAMQALDGTLVLIRDWPKGPEPGPDAPPSRPFDILDYATTFDAATAALTELRAALDEVQVVATSPLLTSSVEEIDTTVRGLVDHVAMRILQVAGLILLGAVLAVVLARRLSRLRKA